MTCIEIFDKNFADNVCSCLTFSPRRVVLVGKEKNIIKYSARYEEIFKERGFDTEFIPVIIDRNDMGKIIIALSEIVEKYDDCTFDLTGGDDQYLVAVGIILERYKGRVQAHCISARTGDMIDCDCDGYVSNATSTPRLTLEESLRLYGGKINYSLMKEWDLNEEFQKDIEKMWEVCVNSPKDWNAQTSFIRSTTLNEATDDELSVVIPMKKLKNQTFGNKPFDVNFIKTLDKAGLFTECICDEKELRLRYKNEQIKRCFRSEGQVLELVVYYLAGLIKEKGKQFYTDAKTGVHINWDNGTDTKNAEVKNEVDVVLMKGMVPVFISCKNGQFDSNELYKLSSVAEKFGGKYAKKIVVTTCEESAEFYRPRATELKIGIVLITKNMPKDSFMKKIKSFWANNG